MKTKNQLSLHVSMIALPLLITACADQHCFNEVRNIATVRNLTGQEQSLEVCSPHSRYNEEKVSRLKVQIASDELNTVSLPSDMDHEVEQKPAMFASGSCKGPEERDARQIRFSLSQKSFQTIRLCKDTQSAALLLVNKNDNCPSGSEAQAEPATCL